MNPIVIRALSKTYRLGFFYNRQVRALDGLDLEIEPGQVYGLVGPNGAGKSTTIKILMNLVQPTSGSATIFGRSPAAPEARRDVGFLPENPAPYEYLTGREFVTLAGTLAGMTRHELDRRVTEVLGLVEMERAGTLQIRRYSKGMIQRIALAQAIVHRPRLLILDEPTSGLDPVGRRQMRDLILSERDRGTTVVFCTHIIPDAEALCDRLAVLVGSRLVKTGAVSELLSAQSPEVEVTAAGIDAATLRGLDVPINQLRELEGRLSFRAADAEAQQLIAKILAAGGRIRQVQPVRFSLEQLFLDAIREAGRGAVGGEIS